MPQCSANQSVTFAECALLRLRPYKICLSYFTCEALPKLSWSAQAGTWDDAILRLNLPGSTRVAGLLLAAPPAAE